MKWFMERLERLSLSEEDIYQLGGKKVLVVGDLMLDRYLVGVVERISPEAPVPILEVKEQLDKPGGASNVAVCVRNLGNSVFLAGVVGRDTEGEQLLSILRALGVECECCVCSSERATTLKVRLVAQNQQLLRYDIERRADLSEGELRQLCIRILSVLESVDGVIVEDYNKGVMCPELIRWLLGQCRERNIPVFVDPKFNNIAMYRQVTLLKLNRREAIYITGTDSFPAMLEKLREMCSPSWLMITLGGDGIVVDDGELRGLVPAFRVEVADVTGAGDMVIAVDALAYLAGMDIIKTATMANLAGALVCTHVGTYAPRREELIDAIRRWM